MAQKPQVVQAIGVAVGRSGLGAGAPPKPTVAVSPSKARKALVPHPATHFDFNRARLAAMHAAATKAQTLGLGVEETKEMIRKARMSVKEP